jgi:hypothetical protein
MIYSSFACRIKYVQNKVINGIILKVLQRTLRRKSMDKQLRQILLKIKDTYRDLMSTDSIYLLDVNIGKEARKMGYVKLSARYDHSEVVIPLKESPAGMKVMIDGRTFVNYAQLELGLIVPNYVAQNAGVPFKHYHAKDSLVRVFA